MKSILRILIILIFISQITCKNTSINEVYYSFDYCKECTTRKDVLEYEKKLNSLAIPPLSDFEYIRIFKKGFNTSPGLDTSYHDTRFRLFFLSKDTSLNCIVAKCYSFWNGYLISKVPNDKILLWNINIKYLYKDDYLNNFLPKENDTIFNYEKLKLFAQSIRYAMDSINNIMTEKYLPLNIENSADFPFKDDMYGYIWTDPNKYAIRLELNYHLSNEIAYDGKSHKIKEKDMAVYFELNYYGNYLDSLKDKYNLPY